MAKIKKTILVLSCLSLFIISCGGGGGGDSGSESGTTQSVIQLGTVSDDVGYSLAIDSSGNIYVAGYTYGSLDGNPNLGLNDTFLVKFDSNGNKKWTRQFGTSESDSGNGVAVDSSGNIYVTGATTGNLDGNTNSGNSDIFVSKFDSSGSKLWTRQLGTSLDESASGIALDNFGNIYVTGTTYGDLDVNINAGSTDMFLVKYDSNGNKQWTRQLGTTAYDSGAGVAVDQSGNIFVTGTTSGALDGNANAGSADIFLVKYDSSGNKIWTKLYGTSSYDSGNAIALDSSGNVYITGHTEGDLDGVTRAYYPNSLYVIKCDASGNRIWTKQDNSSFSHSEGQGVAVDSSGRIYVTGGRSTTSYSTHYYDMIINLYDSSGNSIGNTLIGSQAGKYISGYDIKVNPSGKIIATGGTEYPIYGNAIIGGLDIFLFKW